MRHRPTKAARTRTFTALPREEQAKLPRTRFGQTLPQHDAAVAFFDGIQGKTAILPPPPPSGANEVEQTFERLAVEVLLGGRSPAEVAADFLQQAKDIIARA